MSADAELGPLVARSYTRARRHPWVLGKVGDWTLPLGPYTPAQLIVAGSGVMVLIRTYGLWAPYLGPLPLIALGAMVWAVRSARIGGRVPAAALLGLLTVALEPRAGRIGARPARDRRPAAMRGGFLITDTTDAVPFGQRVAQPVRTSVAPAAHCAPELVRAGAGVAQPVEHGTGVPVAQTALQRLLAASSDRS